MREDLAGYEVCQSFLSILQGPVHGRAHIQQYEGKSLHQKQNKVSPSTLRPNRKACTLTRVLLKMQAHLLRHFCVCPAKGL